MSRKLALAAFAVAALIATSACSNSPSDDTQEARPAGDSDAAAPSVTETDCATAAPAPSVGKGGGTISKPCPETGPATEDSTEVPADFIGSWRSDGPVSQTPPTDPYTMTLTLRPGAAGDVVGHVDYPELGCSGDLRLVDAAPDEVTVTEEITDDPQFTCVPQGTIELTASGDGLDYAFTADDDTSVTGTASLIPA